MAIQNRCPNFATSDKICSWTVSTDLPFKRSLIILIHSQRLRRAVSDY